MRFLEGEVWESGRKAIMFHAQTDDQQLIVCLVPSETLQDRFGASSTQKAELLDAFRRNRRRIEGIARRLIEAQSLENDGSIVIHKSRV